MNIREKLIIQTNKNINTKKNSSGILELVSYAGAVFVYYISLN